MLHPGIEDAPCRDILIQLCDNSMPLQCKKDSGISMGVIDDGKLSFLNDAILFDHADKLLAYGFMKIPPQR